MKHELRRIDLIFIHLAFHTQQCRIIVNLTRYDIELTTGRFFFRIHIVSLTGCRQRSFLMEILRIYKFCRYGVADITGTQHLPFRRIL